jgi:predicted MFS family arabinose efflux permease
VLVGLQQWLALRRRAAHATLWLAIFIASSFLGTWAGAVAGTNYYNHFSNEGAAYIAGGACVGAAIGLLSSVPLNRLLKPRIA